MSEQLLLQYIDIDKIMPIINKISIFGGLKKEQLDKLFRLLQQTKYKRDEIVFKEGSSPNYIYIIISGKVRLVHEKDTVIYELFEYHTGNCFGETALIGIQPHSATAIAFEDTELMVLSKKAFLSLYKSDIKIFALIMMNIAREACRRLSLSNNVMMHYVLKD